MNTRLIVSSLVLVGLIVFFPFSVASADGTVVEGPIHEEGTAVLYSIDFTLLIRSDER